MSMEPDADYLPEEKEFRGYESHESSPSKRQRTDGRRSSSANDVPLARDDDKNFAHRARPFHKRRGGGEIIEPALKRRKGAFNNNYLDLLNKDIEDVANLRTIGEDEDLPPSQVGMTMWTPFEKNIFFDALSRLGKDNIRGISEKVRTKSEVEVRQYIALLQDAVERRGQEQEGGLTLLELADYPAAAEISQPCCLLLDEAADALSFRQERHEELSEQKKWGTCWNINMELAKRIEGDHGFEKDPTFANDHGLSFTEVLRIKAFLQLSDRLFMNASFAENNWQFISEEPPTIRATALQDLHSLLVSVTRKLVLTTLFMADSRIRAKRRVEPSTRNLVRRHDVEAAIASLGMKQNSHEFWATCARRLRLEVWDDEVPVDIEEEEEPMSYDRVESILRFNSDDPKPTRARQESPSPQIKFEENDSSKSADDEDSGSERSSDDVLSAVKDTEEREVIEEAKEVLVYSAYDFPETHRTKEALKNRIRNERAQEAFADMQDAKANCEAEQEMWRLLQRQPPEPLLMPDVVERGRRVVKDVEELHDAGRQWRERTAYHSEWEMLGLSQLPGRKF
ncbi:hypothetical protein CCHL11_04873 [Colletotrichum chlorophyti]|uniref:RNA polymerase I-specific transcription initiation factor rrn5 n=1 Tax=Colletotrichum chlorophyti TaxID=708187 RepID=A0A1Q8S2G2_9PEZI|nr:hypothetical protein CCHL11_04873 [Colletotrichum chlorophyti]